MLEYKIIYILSNMEGGVYIIKVYWIVGQHLVYVPLSLFSWYFVSLFCGKFQISQYKSSFTFYLFDVKIRNLSELVDYLDTESAFESQWGH